MNPNYPVNPSPFTQHPSAYPTAPAAINGAASGATQPQYYSMHSATYASSPQTYGSYPQYAQQMMVYRPVPTSTEQQPTTLSSSFPTTVPPSTGKRKRKSDGGRDKALGEKDSDQEAPSPNDLPSKHSSTTAPSPTNPTDSRKRTKTQRACDSCRSRKIRYAHIPVDGI